MLIILSRKEYLYSLQNFSSNYHMTEFLTNKIDKMIKKIRSNKIRTIVLNNTTNIKAAREAISLKYLNIMNLRCIAYCFNFIFQDIIKILFAKKLLCYCNIIVIFFKILHITISLKKN